MLYYFFTSLMNGDGNEEFTSGYKRASTEEKYKELSKTCKEGSWRDCRRYHIPEGISFREVISKIDAMKTALKLDYYAITYNFSPAVCLGFVKDAKVCIHLYVHAFMHISIYTHIHSFIHTYIHTYMRAHILTYIHVFLQMLIYTYSFTYTCTRHSWISKRDYNVWLYLQQAQGHQHRWTRIILLPWQDVCFLITTDVTNQRFRDK